MHDANPAIIDALASGKITPFLLFSMTIGEADFCYTSCDIPIPYGGRIYRPREFEFTGARYSMSNIVDRVTVTVDNLDDELTAAFLAGEAEDAPADLSCVLLDDEALGDGRLEFIGGEAATIFPGHIDDWSWSAERSVVVTIASPLAAWGRTFSSLHSSSCRYRRFKGARCGYSGEETWCDRSYARCRELGNTDNFGGFRWLPSLEEKEIWWGRNQG